MWPREQQQQQQQQQQPQRKKRLAFATIPYIAAIDKKLKRAFLSNDVDYHSRPGPKLGDILCKANKTPTPPMELCGVYEQQCDCCPTAKYIGQTRVNFGTCMEQHRNDVFSNEPDKNNSGISKHARHCTSGTINWDEPKILATFNDKSKKALQQNCLLRENLEIRRQKTAMGQGLNDPQLFAKSNAWDPLLRELKDM